MRRKKSEELTRLADEAVRLAFIRLALNVPTVLYPEDGGAGREEVITPELKLLLKETAEAAAAGNAPGEETKEKVFRLREENTARMKALSWYVDRFTVYEYILNRLEHKFDMFILPEDYTDEGFTQSILQSMASLQDQAARQPMLINILEQLPMRMTASRFYQIVEDGLSVYANADRETIDQIFYLLRSAALLDDIDASDADPHLDELVSEFSTIVPDDIDEHQWQQLSERLAGAMQELNDMTDDVITRQDLLNDLSVICLLDVSPEDQTLAQCAHCILKALELEGKENSWDELMPEYSALEGLQEASLDRYDRLSSAFDDCDDEAMLIVRDLNTSNRFTSIRRNEADTAGTAAQSPHKEAMPEGYLGIMSSNFLSDIAMSFKSRPRIVNRAVMSKVLALLPAFLRSYDELENYIAGSLSSCTNPAEKKAAYEIISGLLQS